MNDNKKVNAIKHFFDVSLAEEVGIVPAILYENISFWIQKNKANGKHLHDGLYWTYNSTRAFSELFPYLSEDQISRGLKKLEEANLIVRGNYNETKYDRTSWFAIPQICEMDSADSQDRNRKNLEPIPDINQIQKPDINVRVERIQKSTHSLIQEFFQNFWMERYDMPCKINLFKIQEISVACNEDFELFLKVVDKYLKDPFWGSKALSPELLMKAWHTLGNVNKVEDWKRLGYSSEKEYKKPIQQNTIGFPHEQESSNDDFVNALKNIKRFKDGM